MTKHRDVNKCRRQEKYKMAALIRQTNKQVWNGQCETKGKKERTLGEKEGEQREKARTLSEKKEEASNVSEQRDKGWIHVIHVHDTTHLAVTTTQQGNRRSRTTPHKERMRGLVKHQDYPPHSYIVNEQYNSRNKRANQEKKTVNGKNW